MRTIWSALLLSCVVGAGGGCQSWSQLGQSMSGGTRVPPPGTGTYSVPSSYYNGQKTSSAPVSNTGSTLAGTGNSAAGMGAPAPGTVTTAAWQPPTPEQLRQSANNMASAAINDATNRANQGVQAGTSRAAAVMEEYTSPTPMTDASAPTLTTTRTISDDTPAISSEPPKLNWQAPR